MNTKMFDLITRLDLRHKTQSKSIVLTMVRFIHFIMRFSVGHLFVYQLFRKCYLICVKDLVTNLITSNIIINLVGKYLCCISIESSVFMFIDTLRKYASILLRESRIFSYCLHNDYIDHFISFDTNFWARNLVSQIFITILTHYLVFIGMKLDEVCFRIYHFLPHKDCYWYKFYCP